MLGQPGKQAFTDARGMQKHPAAHPRIYLEESWRLHFFDVDRFALIQYREMQLAELLGIPSLRLISEFVRPSRRCAAASKIFRARSTAVAGLVSVPAIASLHKEE